MQDMNELKNIKWNLVDMAEKEAQKLFRFARKSESHGCSQETVSAIREEARWLHGTATAYPERLLSDQFAYEFHYAFRLSGC